jgi:hypothetical protein
MQKKQSRLEIAKNQILCKSVGKNLPVFYRYVVCKAFSDSPYVIPFKQSNLHNTDCYSVIAIYKPLINSLVTLTDFCNERDSL